MPDYDFRSLSPYEFQALVHDLLEERLGVGIESFSPGPDSGIDLRFEDAGGSGVIQCKHWIDSGYSALLSELKRVEVEKVRRLAPRRYMIATSVALTPRRKDAIRQLFRPFCRSMVDIRGPADLNALLRRYPDVEKAHFKLWLTSEAVLSRILRPGILVDSDLAARRMEQRLSRYVPNPSFPRALEILQQHHYCIIAGPPGIGKTTLAEALCAHYIARGFQLVPIRPTLAQVTDARNPRKKQVFYYDDFLGRTNLDKLDNNEDQRIVEFMADAEQNDRWRFLLTTREYILNAARTRYETLAHPPLELRECVINLSDYTGHIRARILYNHIYFSDLPSAPAQPSRSGNLRWGD